MKNEKLKKAFDLQNPTSYDRERIFEEIIKKIPAYKNAQGFQYYLTQIKWVSIGLAAMLCVIILVSDITNYALINRSLFFNRFLSTDEPSVTGEPVTDEPVTDEPVTDEPVTTDKPLPTDKPLIYSYFSEEDALKIDDLMYDDGQQVIIDDYTITLESVLYEHGTTQGYLLFSVVREGYNMLDEHVELHNYFGEDERFSFDINNDFFTVMGGDTYNIGIDYTKKQENVVYLFCSLESVRFHDPVDKIFDGTLEVLLCDAKDMVSEEKKEGYRGEIIGSFKLKTKTKTKIYQFTENDRKCNMIVSPFFLGLEMTGDFVEVNQRVFGDICIYYKDGGKKYLLKDNEIMVGYEKSSSEFGKGYRVGYVLFNSLDVEYIDYIIDVENIDYITYNDEKLPEYDIKYENSRNDFQ